MNAIVLLALAVMPRAEPPLPEGAIARLGSPAERPRPEDYEAAIGHVAFLPDSKSLVSASLDGNVRVWDVTAQQMVRSWRPELRSLNSLAVSADGKLAATAGRKDNVIRIFEIATGKELHSLKHPADVGVESLAFAPASTTLAASSYGNAARTESIRLWDAADGREVGKLAGARNGTATLSFHPDGKSLLATVNVTQPDQSARIWDTSSGKAIDLAFDRGGAIAPDGRSFAVVRNRPGVGFGDLVLVEWASRRERLILSKESHVWRVLAFSPDSRLLATAPPLSPGQGRLPNGVSIWELDNGLELKHLDAGERWSLAFSPDGKLLATGARDGMILLWDVAKLRPARPKVEVTDSLWSDLAADAVAAYRAVVKLGDSGDRGVALLRERLKNLKPVDEKKLAALFTDLESDSYAARRKAVAELAGLEVGPDRLRGRLTATTSTEARKALTQLLEKLDGWSFRGVRAVEALQRNDTPEASKLLQELAAGDPAARLTIESSEALRRR
jgi:WD40 repeat protein